jgi:hypothetical protein
MIPYDSTDGNSLPTGYKEPTSVTKLALKRGHKHITAYPANTHINYLHGNSNVQLAVYLCNIPTNDTSGSGALHASPTSGRRYTVAHIHATFIPTYIHCDAAKLCTPVLGLF